MIWLINTIIHIVRQSKLGLLRLIGDLNGKEAVGRFYGIQFQKTNQTEFRVEKVIKRKCDRLYVNWKDYDISFNSWFDEKDKVI